MAYSLSSSPLFWLSVILTLLAVLYHRSRKAPTLPDLPWVNRDPQKWFSKLRARVTTTVKYKESVFEAYTEYSKQSKSCIFGSLSEDIIVLPSESVPWMIDQPDSVLCSIDVLKTQLQLEHTFEDPGIVHHPMHHDTIKQDLTRQLANLTEDLIDELTSAFNDGWGRLDEEWNEVCVFQTMMRIVARASNRVLVGPGLCRDEKVLDHAAGWAQAVPVTATIIRTLPGIVRPVLAPLISWTAHKHARAYSKFLIPEIERRQHSSKATSNDFLQWQINRGAASGLAIESDPRNIALRLLAVNLAAIHTSTFSITNTIFDLVSSDLANIVALREEAEHALAATDNKWSKQTIQLLFKHDSALRESSRLGSFIGVGLIRRVVAPKGLVTPNGTHCPYDTWVGVPTTAIHHDPDFYEDVETYKPFRFSEMREDAVVDEKNKSEALIKKANLSFVSLSPQYMPFGHGRHACPGRFFAANELKLLLAYMVLNYDFEHIKNRPESKWYGPNKVPPLTATIRIRKRKSASA